MMEGDWDTTENASNMAEGVWDVTKDMCTRSLIRAANKDRPCNEDEEVEENTECRDTKDNRCDSRVNLPKVPGECATEKQQRNL